MYPLAGVGTFADAVSWMSRGMSIGVHILFYPSITALIVFNAGATPNEIVTTFVDVTTAPHCTIALSDVLRT